MWLEMSRDEEHGGAGWQFTECLWSPSYKNPRGHWSFWQLLLSVRKGDVVVHLRGKTHRAAFIGYSIADADGYETTDRPTEPKDWGYANSYYRVPLTGFVPFVNPISLDAIFAQENDRLKAFFQVNKSRPKAQREHIFYVFQSNRLQCLNGAYLSELGQELAGILLGPDFSGSASQPRPPAITTATGQQIATIAARVGQGAFSENVRENYGHQCCFPECGMNERPFLVASHIAHWADTPTLRGETANGLCFCLLHDKAFESGLFTLTNEFRVVINQRRAAHSAWAQANLVQYAGHLIRLGPIAPSLDALCLHWHRIGHNPE